MVQGAPVATGPGLVPAGQLRAVVFGAGGILDGAPGGSALPSAVALARALRAAGLRTAVTSAAGDCAALLAVAGVAGLFDVRVDGLDAARLGLAAAPDPALPLEAARRLGVPAAKAMLVEDTPAAVQAGRRGGFGLVVGVERVGRPEALREHGADLAVDDLGRLRIEGDGGRELLERGFDAIVLRWEGAVADDPAGAAPRVEALCQAGVEVAVLAELPLQELDERLGVRPKGPGRLLLCPGGGLVARDADALRPLRPLRPARDGRPGALGGVLAELGARGIGSGLVLVVGADFGPPADPGADAAPLLHPAARAVVASVGAEPRGAPPGVVVLGGGAGALLELLDRQLERRAAGRCPGVDADPAWTVALEVDQRLERVAETLCTVADGHFGTRGSREEGGPGSEPLTVAAGVFDERPGNPLLLAGPLWTGLRAPAAERDRRLLDLRTGTLRREWSGAGDELRSLRFASQVRPGVVGLRAEGAGGTLAAGPALRPPSEDTYEQRRDGDQMWAGTSAPGAGIVAAAWQREAGGATRVVERIAAYVADPSAHPDPGEALERLRDARADGFDRLLAEHRAAWAARWADAAVTVEGDPPTELALRLAVFHLLSSAAGGGEHAFGARGLSGPVYRGHVFWDADVFVLPVLAALDPAAARAMIEYRIRRLPAARRLAARRGRAGARFPWESAGDGDEVTPDWAPDLEGRMVRILTGEMEEHIVADVAWALCRYADWTGDHALVEGAGRPLLVETARYWPSRVRLDEDGVAHIDQVIGPDEYHEGVDDNAFTNVMARWHLRRAAALVEREGPAGAEEAAAWRRLAGALVDGHDPGTGVYRQFAGFEELEPLLVATFAEPPVAADVLLGRERTRRTQVIKQADVLMLHLLVPEEVAPGSLAPNLAFYGPRTAHGSSLSPAVHAGLLARAGEPDRALELFRLACQLDLQDLTGTTAGGLHVATFGGVWQALVHGFLGVRLLEDALGLDPHLPAAWQAVELRLRWHGRRVRLRAEHGAVEVAGDGPLRVALPGLPAAAVPAAGTRFTWSGTAWEEAP